MKYSDCIVISVVAGLSNLNGQIKDVFRFVGPVIDPQRFGAWLIQEV